MTRAEHIAFAKRRALEELDAGRVVDAVNSMTTDLTKHEETSCPHGPQRHRRGWVPSGAGGLMPLAR
jgi:hypothetical protein